MASLEYFNRGRSIEDKKAWELPVGAFSDPFVRFLGWLKDMLPVGFLESPGTADSDSCHL